MDAFLSKFFPSVYESKQAEAGNNNPYCTFNSCVYSGDWAGSSLSLHPVWHGLCLLPAHPCRSHLPHQPLVPHTPCFSPPHTLACSRIMSICTSSPSLCTPPISPFPPLLPSTPPAWPCSNTLSLFTSSLFIAGLVMAPIASQVTRRKGRKVSMLSGGLWFLLGGILK